MRDCLCVRLCASFVSVGRRVCVSFCLGGVYVRCVWCACGTCACGACMSVCLCARVSVCPCVCVCEPVCVLVSVGDTFRIILQCHLGFQMEGEGYKLITCGLMLVI